MALHGMRGYYFSPEGSGSKKLIDRTGTTLPTIQLDHTMPSRLVKAAYIESGKVGVPFHMFSMCISVAGGLFFNTKLFLNLNHFRRHGI